MPSFALGWFRQKPDPRDWKFEVPRRTILHLPVSADLSASMGEYLDQGALGSCGPNTADECIEFDEKIENISPVVSKSRLYIYYNTRVVMGTQYINQDSGVDNRSMLKALAQYGYCDESLWPYDISKFTQQPPKACYDAAEVISNYAAVSQTLDQMNGTIAGGRPFMFGFDCFSQIMSDEAMNTGIIRDPPAGATPIGGHDMTACGYNATSGNLPGVLSGNVWPAGTLKLRQHWTRPNGSSWGDGGYGYISFAYATGPHASDFWVINAIPTGSGPNPPNPPGPNRPSPCKPVARIILAGLSASFAEAKRQGIME